MTWLNIVGGLYALLNIGGGIEGYVSKGSVPSIISGCVAGVLLFVGLFVAASNQRVGYIICGVIALGDLGFFAPRFFKTQAIWPPLIMAIASLAVLACLAVAHFGSGKP